MSGFLLHIICTYIVLRDFSVVKINPNILLFNSSFSPHWKCHCPPPFPSFTFPPSQWPRLGCHPADALTGRAVKLQRREPLSAWLRGECWGQQSLRFFCDIVSPQSSHSTLSQNTIQLLHFQGVKLSFVPGGRRFLITAVFQDVWPWL